MKKIKKNGLKKCERLDIYFNSTIINYYFDWNP